MGTNVNTPIFQVLRLEFGHSAGVPTRVHTIFVSSEQAADPS